MPPKKGPNQKAVAGNAKKDAAADKKAAELAAQERAKEEKEWAKGANNRKAERDGDAAAKADEAARKKREKAELMAAEEAALAGVVTKVKKPAPPAKNKKKNDLALLENALVSAADKKVKAKKAEEREKQQQKQNMVVVETVPQTESDKLLAATDEMLLGEGVGRQANMDRMKAEETSGLDNALSSLGVSAQGEVKSAKALYNEFEAKMLPIVKEENPGLRLSQYKEKIWNLWKKSPDNPANQVPMSA